jgi:hypothetical protein
VFTAGAGTPVVVLLGGGLATAGGIAGTTVGATNLALSYSGQTTAQQDREIVHAANTTLALSSPGGLIGGTTGLLITGDERGLQRGALIGGVTEAGYGLTRLGAAAFRSGSFTQLSTDPALAGQATTMQGTIPRGTMVLSTHGGPGIVEVAGNYLPVQDLGPMITAGNPARVTVLACEVGQNAASVQQLANAVGRPVTVYTQVVGANTFNNVVSFTRNAAGAWVPAGTATPTIINPSLPVILSGPLRYSGQISAAAQSQGQ